MTGLLLFDPFGIVGLFFLMLGIAGAFIYGVLVAYERISIYNWKRGSTHYFSHVCPFCSCGFPSTI